MKLNSFFILALSVLLCACDDDLTNIGSSIRPDGDDLIVKSAIFDIKSNTFLADSIYVRTPNPLLGEINDNLYGTIRANYAAQFYAKPGFNFDVYKNDSLIFKLGKDSLLNNRLDSAVLSITYAAYIGDSLTPMAVTAYELTKTLPTDNNAFYSNYMASEDFIQDYITPLKEIGSAGYTGKDLSVSDSIRNLEGYIPYVDIILDNEIAQRFLNEVKNNPATFKTQQAFEKFFPGVYFKNTFGNGTILQVSSTSIGFFYRSYHTTKTDAGKDSSYVSQHIKTIAVTPDVVQLNNIANPIQPGGNPEIMNNDSATFVTSPAGYFTQIKLPVGSIMKTLKESGSTEQYLNGVNLNMLAYPQTNIFFQGAPKNMLLIEKSKMNEFFENNQVPDSKTSYLASLPKDSTSANYGYNFGNINAMVLELAKEMKSKNNRELTEADTATLAIVPVSVSIDQTYGTIKRTANYFLPGGISLKGGKNMQKTTMVYTLKINQ
ncbi:MAG: DUF4270 domain-containing protein [Bacteroidales bacterium]